MCENCKNNCDCNSCSNPLDEIINKFVSDIHYEYVGLYDEAMDGDKTEQISIIIKNKLDVLNGNT